MGEVWVNWPGAGKLGGMAFSGAVLASLPGHRSCHIVCSFYYCYSAAKVVLLVYNGAIS